MFEVSNAKRQSPGFPVWVPRVGDFRLFWDALGCSWLILVKLGQGRWAYRVSFRP